MSTYPNTLESIIGPTIESVLNELEEIHPPLNPTPNESMEEIMYRSGQQSVVQYVKKLLEEE